MKNIKFLAIMLCITAVSLFMGACSLPCFMEEFEGTWEWVDAIGDKMTVIADKEEVTMKFEGTMNGSMVYELVKYDVAADTLELKSKSGTGDFAGMPAGVTMYVKYKIENGKTMHFSMDGSAYPADPDSFGPFTKK